MLAMGHFSARTGMSIDCICAMMVMVKPTGLGLGLYFAAMQWMSQS